MNRTTPATGRPLWWKFQGWTRLISLFVLLALLLAPLPATGQIENPDTVTHFAHAGSEDTLPTEDSDGSTNPQTVLDDQETDEQSEENLVYLPILRKSRTPIIPETTVVLTEQTIQHLGAISPDDSLYTFNQVTTELAQLDPGDVMVTGVSATTPEGFLRKVTDVQVEGDRVQITTVQGTLEDAIEQGELHVSQQLTPSMVIQEDTLEGVQLLRTTSNQFYFQLTEVVLYDVDGSDQTTYDQIRANGQLTIEPYYYFDIEIGFFSLEELTFYVLTTETAKLEITAYTEAVGTDKEIPLTTYYCYPITVYIGPVPVVITPVVSIVVGLEGGIYAGVSTSVTQSLGVYAGVNYSDNDWSTPSDFNNSFSWDYPTISTNANFKGYLGPELMLALYGITGPYARIQAFTQLEVDLYAGTHSLYGGLEIPVGVQVQALGREFADQELFALGLRWLLYEFGGGGT